jgi:AraC family transcriptional regulator
MCQTNRFLVKGMVCRRCVSIVQQELSNLNIPVTSITLGQVSLQAPLKSENIDSVRQALEVYGFEVIDDRQSGLVKNVKAIVEEMFSDDFDLTEKKFSKYISSKLYKDYDFISSSFSSCQGITLEKYIINRRIEKVKELLVYSDQSISNIAFNLGYSSVAHLSKQFKAVTGLSLSHFREVKKEKQIAAALAA